MPLLFFLPRHSVNLLFIFIRDRSEFMTWRGVEVFTRTAGQKLICFPFRPPPQDLKWNSLNSERSLMHHTQSNEIKKNVFPKYSKPILIISGIP